MKFLRIPVGRLWSKNFTNQFKLQSTYNHVEWQQPSGSDTGISIYNCIAKKKVPLILNNNLATWYSCGPTVYDSAHIGHASCYVKLDIIQRILIDYFNLNLITSMGVTDIDDKIIKRSQESEKSPEDIAKEYELEFWKNMSDLGVSPPNIITRVTEHIPAIKEFIAEIARKKLTYSGPDKSVYFDTVAFGDYGKLQGAQEGEKELDSFHKKSLADFALWKAHKPGEPYWEADWGNGRPGWHIECSAMASRLFGKTVDFHAGGIDLQFPHHENEEAQSCAYHGSKQWVNYWLHPGHLHIKGDVKMSKSLKNTISVNDLLKSHNASTFRMACLLSHYRNPMEYGTGLMKNSKAVVAKLKYVLEECSTYMNNNKGTGVIDEVKLLSDLQNTKLAVHNALKDDFDTAKCMTKIIQLASETSKMLLAKPLPDSVSNDFKPIAIGLVAKYIKSTMNCFGINLDKHQVENTNVPDIIDTLVKFRHSVRVQALETKQVILLKECDNVRNVLQNYNVKINDQGGSLAASWIYTE